MIQDGYKDEDYISDEDEDWWDKSPRTPHPSEDWDVETDYPPFYIPIRRTITVEYLGVRCPSCGCSLQRSSSM